MVALTVAAIAGLYVSMALLYYAHPTRFSWKHMSKLPHLPATLRVCAVLAMSLAALACCRAIGTERGIALWFGLLCAAGTGSLIAATLTPRAHRLSVPIAASVATIAAVWI